MTSNVGQITSIGTAFNEASTSTVKLSTLTEVNSSISELITTDGVFAATTLPWSTTADDKMTTRLYNETTEQAGRDLVTHDFTALLYAENDANAKALIPVTVFLIILMITGVIGNIIVLYVYKFRFKRSTSRVFILSLAAFDLCTCLLGMPYHIMDTTFPLVFVWDTACKVLSASITFTVLASIFVLDLIAIDRYRKICFPFGKQLSAKGTKMTCWVVAGISLLLAIPMLFIYGSVDVETRWPNVTGRECYISADMMETEIPLIYDAMTLLIFGVSVIILICLYIKVGIVVKKRKSFHDSFSSRNGSKMSHSGTSTPDTTVIQMNTLVDDPKHETVHAVSSLSSGKVHFGPSTPIVKNKNSTHNPSPGINKKWEDMHKKRLKRLMSELSSASEDEGTIDRGTKVTKKKQMRTIRITAMLFIITLIFVISFLPYLTISILNSLDESFWNELSMSELVILSLLMRTYFINNMVNPIIYWFLDHKFNQEVRKLFKNLKKCKFSKTFKLDKKSFNS